MATSSLAPEPDWANSTPKTARISWLKIAKIAAVVLICCMAAVTWQFSRLWFMGNLGVVDPGKVIRCAQPTDRLNAWLDEYHVKSILNLRGGSSADWWYDAEVRAAQDHDVAFFDWPLSATRRPRRREILTLIDILNGCSYPLLIHCKSGADRTGLASALYLMVQRQEPPELAERAFSLDFGHIPFAGPEHLHEPLNEYAQWLRSKGLAHTPERFRTWVKFDYRSDDPPGDPPRLMPGPRTRRS